VLLCAALENQSIQQQQDHGANDRHDPTRDIIFARKNATDPGTNERAGNAEQNCNDTATGIFSWHQQFRNGADDEADYQNPENRMSAKVHNESSSIGFAQPPQELSDYPLLYNSITCAEWMSSLARIAVSTFSLGAVSRFKTVSAVPPA
jgi:hypothetical protein